MRGEGTYTINQHVKSLPLSQTLASEDSLSYPIRSPHNQLVVVPVALEFEHDILDRENKFHDLGLL